MFTPKITIAIRQIERWLIAAAQDLNPGIAYLHANYAVGDIDMLRQMFTDAEIASASGKDILELHKRAIQMQDHAQTTLLRKCKGASMDLAGWPFLMVDSLPPYIPF